MLIDVNVYLSRWPFRRLYGDEPAELVEKLRGAGVVQAWAGNFDSLLHKDVSAVNVRTAEICRSFGDGLLFPVGSINPTLPDWTEDLRRCDEELGMKVLRLHPNYHGYELDFPEFHRLLRMAHERRLIVQLAVKMEDERTQHPLVQVKPVDVAGLPELLSETPGLRMVVLNGLRELQGENLVKLIGAGEVFVDLAMLEGVGGVARLIEQIGSDRLLFGSLAPLFHFESAKLKLRESVLTDEQREATAHANARRLLGSGGQGT